MWRLLIIVGLCLAFTWPPASSQVVFTDSDRSPRPRLCSVNTGIVKCTCSRNRRTGLYSILCECQNINLATRQFVFNNPFAQDRRMSLALPRLAIASFEIRNCDQIELDKDMLQKPSVLQSFRLSKIQKLYVASGALQRDATRGGLTQVTIEEIGGDLALDRGAISGSSFSAITISNVVNMNAGSKAFGNMAIGNVSIFNVNISVIPTDFMQDVVLDRLQFSGNEVGKLHSGAFEVHVGHSAVFEVNTFHQISSLALGEVMLASSATFNMSDNFIAAYEPNALALPSSSIHLQRLIIHQPCKCNLIEELFGPQNSTSFDLYCFDGIIVNILMYFEVKCKGSPVTSTLKSVCDDDHCNCTSDRMVQCHCQGANDTKLLIGDGSGHRFVPDDTKQLTIKECPHVEIKLDSVATLTSIEIEQVPSLSFVSSNDVEGDSHALSVVVKNCKVVKSFDPRSFRGSFIKSLSFENVSTKYIHHEAFVDLDLRLLNLTHITVMDKVFTGAFKAIKAETVVVKDSLFQSVDSEAFQVMVGDSMTLDNLTFNELDRKAFVALTSSPVAKSLKGSNQRPPTLDIGHWIINNAEFGALVRIIMFMVILMPLTFSKQITDESWEGQSNVANISLAMDCSCDLFKLVLNLGNHSENKNPLINSLSCLAQGLYTSWLSFDLEHCQDHDDHDHGQISFDKTRLSFTYMVLYIILGVLAAVLVFIACSCILCWKKVKKPQVVPILPIGDDEDDNWKQVIFERTDVTKAAVEHPDQKIRRSKSQGANEAKHRPIYMNLVHNYYNTDPANFTRVSAITVMDEEELCLNETQTFVEGYDSTLDIIQDVNLARSSLP